MTHLRQLFFAAVTGVAAYLIVFCFAVQKPLTVGAVKSYFDFKTEYLASIAGENKILIFAGSNGRFSHRCQTIEQATGVHCANLSTAAGYDLKWQFLKYSGYLRKGDVLYLPLEYFHQGPPPAIVGNEGPYIVAYDRSALFKVYDKPVQIGYALFSFDLKSLFSSIGEMTLSAMGKERRFSAKTMTANGDESGHDAAKGLPYRDFVNALVVPGIDGSAYVAGRQWDELDEIVRWSTAHGIKVVGGLPTTFDDVIIPDQTIAFLADFYRSRGQCFLELPNKSLYPRSYFYDTFYHLGENFQISHSAALAPHLARILKAGSCS